MPELRTLGLVIAKAAAPYEEPQNSVRNRALVGPPLGAADGDRYIVAANAVGAWVGHDQHIAWLDGSTWRFLAPTEGTSTWVDAEDKEITWNGSVWVTSGGDGAIATPSNKRMPALPTLGDGDLACGIAVSRAPAPGSYVGVSVNGVTATELGDGTRGGAVCYFSGDAGSSARAWAAISVGDTLHWQGSVAGYQLAGSDVIDFWYEEKGS